MTTIQVNDSICLSMPEREDAAELFKVVDSNREYLRVWLPWVDNMQSVANFEEYIISSKQQAAEKTDYGFSIMINDKIAGRIGMHKINRHNKIGEIGYWLAEGMQGQGIITRSCKTLIQFGFYSLGLNRIEIKCGTGNHKSKAIAEKLKFKQEGILRQAEWLNGKFIDLYLFAMLKEGWESIL